MTELITGIFEDMPIDEYHAHPHLSNSGIGRLMRSPLHYKEHEQADTAALRMGRAVHTLTLEPHLFKQEFAVAPKVDRRTKDGKAQYAAWLASKPANATDLTVDEWTTANACAQAIRSHELVRTFGMLNPERAKFETSLFTEIKTDEGPCYIRARMDAWMPGLNSIFDIKTTREATKAEFERSVSQYSYHVQAALYIRVARTLGLDVHDDGFYFVVVEKSEPYGVRLFALDDQALEQGDRDLMRAAELWAKCHRTGNWPGYEPKVETVCLRPWMIDRE